MSEDSDLIPVEDIELIQNELGLKPEEEYIDSDGRIFTVVGVRRGKQNGYENEKVQTLVILRSSWGSTRAEPLSCFLAHSRQYIKLPGGFEKAARDNQAFFDNPELLDPDMAEDSDSKAIIASTANRAQMMQAATRFQVVADKAMMLERILKHKKNEIWQITVKMQRRVAYLNKIMEMIEAYLGVYEQIVKIKDGDPAPIDTPIHILQTILWMDEEVGDVELRRGGQVGVDFHSIQVFDDWVTRDGNWRNILPYEKCIVGIKPSRQFRDYGDAFANMEAKARNNAVYLLIRNGDIFYRIETGLVYGDVLFPELDTWQQIVEAIAKAEESEYEDEIMKTKQDMIHWQSRVALLQGLVDRTDVMNPKPSNLDMFAESDYESGRIVLHRDYETMSLPDGWDDYFTWREKLNARLTRGSRVLLADIPGRYRWENKDEWKCRFDNRFLNTCPPLPEPGIYKVVEVVSRLRRYSTTQRETLYKILFNPGDDVLSRDRWGWATYDTRKKRVSFLLSEFDGFILNYDDITLEEVSFYIGRRVERRRYMEVLPVLYQIYRQRLEETKLEAEFVGHLARIEGFEEAAVWEAVEWWKKKNIWKRPLGEDNDKAWRMIRKRLEK